MLLQPDGVHDGLALGGRHSVVAVQELKQRAVVDAHQHPADVEDDVVNACGHGLQDSGVTLPVSPGRVLTATTVALGKKLNSVALAQV